MMKLVIASLAVLGIFFISSAPPAAEWRVRANLAPIGGSGVTGLVKLSHLPTHVIANRHRQGAASASYYESGVALGSAGTFAILAASTVTNTGASTVTGDLGLSPSTAITGFPPGTVSGTFHLGDPASAQAQLDLSTAYNDAAGRTAGAILIAGNLGGLTLAPGLYHSTTSLEISSGDLTLDAQGDANGVFVFQMASTLITTTGRKVILAGGAQAANVYWQVGSSATVGTNSVFKGNILAYTSVTVATGSSLEGRLLVQTGAVSLDGDVVVVPAVVTAGVTGNGTMANHVSLTSNPVGASSATVRFGLATADRVEIKVYDVGSRVVRTLVNREFEAGEHEVEWDRLDSSGRPASLGLYFMQVSYARQGFATTRKLTIIQ